MTNVLIAISTKLTKGETDLWDWALGGMECALDDDDFMRDNPDMTTAEGQWRDMGYRIGIQAIDMADAADTIQAETAAIRIAESLFEKIKHNIKGSIT